MVTFSFIQRVLSSCYLYLRLVALGIFLSYTTACSTIAKYGMDSGSQELKKSSTKPVIGLEGSKNYFEVFKWGFENNYPAVVQSVLEHHLSDVRAGAEGDYLKTVMPQAFDRCEGKPPHSNAYKMVKVLLDSEIVPVNALDHKGWFPIWYHVLQAPYAHIVPMVLNHPSVDVNVKSSNDKHAIHYLLGQFTKYPIEQSIKLLGLFLDNNKVKLNASEYDSFFLRPL